MVARELRPDAFAVVMATGIVSIAAGDQAEPWIRLPLAALATVLFVVLVAGLVMLSLADAASTIALVRDPDNVLRLFTFVAACAVLDARFDAEPAAAWLLAGLAAAGWLILTPLTVHALRSRRLRELREQAHGAWLLVSVATAGLAITAADLAAHTRWQAMIVMSAVAWVLAIVLYLAVTCLIVWRAVATPFVPDEVTPDSWILMGALAISTLAGARLFAAFGAFGATGIEPWCADVVGPVIVVLWILASLWIPVLLYAQIWRIHLRPGSMRYAAAWWSAVFPLGMYSTATQATAVQMHLRALVTVALVFFWIAFCVWAMVAAGWLHSQLSTARRRRGRPRATTPLMASHDRR